MFGKIRRSFRKKKVFYCVSCGRVHKESANCDYENVSVFEFVANSKKRQLHAGNSRGSEDSNYSYGNREERSFSEQSCYSVSDQSALSASGKPFWTAKHIEVCQVFLHIQKNV